ncbi:hypothetical protein HY489_05160 [Candidatus Woesearchaeota archaeon]|nr:hypothetical protein [Candidatus Woesearchaeota archaeon]
MIDYRLAGGALLGIVVLYFVMRALSQFALSRMAEVELEEVLNSDKHRVKGRYG